MPNLADTKRIPSDSKAARFAFIAAKFAAAKPTAEWFATNLGLELSVDQAERAIRPVRYRSESKRRRGRPPRSKSQSPSHEPWILREWALVRDEKFGLIKILMTVETGDNPEIASSVARLRGVVHVMSTSSSRQVLAVALFRNTIEERHTRASLEEITTGEYGWEPLISETFEPSIATWQQLAKAQAEEEGLVRI